MSILVNIATVIVGAGLIFFVIRLIVKRKMSESQSVLWIGIGVVAIILGIFPGLITGIADLLGIWYAPSILLLVATIGLLLILFRNTTVISVHENEIYELTIQIALLKDENEALKEKVKEMERDLA